LINSLSAIGDDHFMAAREFAEKAGFDLYAESDALKDWSFVEAENGDPEAQHALSEFLSVGLFGEPEKFCAYEWCVRAANQGFAPAIHLLSGFYFEGWAGLEIDHQRARELMEEAASQGYAPALRSLAILYLIGTGVNQDAKVARRYLEQAAIQHDSYSQLILGRMIVEDGEPTSISEGVRWVEAAAEKEFPSALRELSQYYADGCNGFPVDKELSLRYAERAQAAEKKWYDKNS
jgi:TPR repeat protein